MESTKQSMKMHYDFEKAVPYIYCSEQSETLFNDYRTTRAHAEGKNPLLVDFIGSQTS